MRDNYAVIWRRPARLAGLAWRKSTRIHQLHVRSMCVVMAAAVFLAPFNPRQGSQLLRPHHSGVFLGCEHCSSRGAGVYIVHILLCVGWSRVQFWQSLCLQCPSPRGQAAGWPRSELCSTWHGQDLWPTIPQPLVVVQKPVICMAGICGLGRPARAHVARQLMQHWSSCSCVCACV